MGFARLSMTVALLLIFAGGLGCSPSKAEIAAKQRDDCFATQRRILLAINLVHADSGFYPTMQDVIKQLDAKCPAGGTYRFDENTDSVSCSVHGVAPKSPAP